MTNGSKREKPQLEKEIQIWAGIECTVNRIGDEYFDQINFNGHAYRLDDVDLFAELGVKTLRDPVLWERTAQEGIEQVDWTWIDERLERLRQLHIRTTLGLVHHGCGP